MGTTAVINTTVDPRTRQVTLPVGRDFAAWTISDARAVIEYLKQQRTTVAGFEANRLYAEAHDHWMNAGGWVGPDGGSDMQARTATLTNVKRQFTPVDVIAEVLDNIANALLGTEASVSFVPVEPAEEGSTAAEAQQEEADAMVEVLSRWWDDRRLWELARICEKRARSYTWGTLRAWMPSPVSQASAEASADAATASPDTVVVRDALTGAVSTRPADPPPERPMPTGLSFADALDQIYLTCPAADQAYVYTDPDTQERCAIFLWASGVEQFMELAWINPETGKTVMRLVRGTSETEATVELDLGGQLPTVLMETDLLITEPVRMQQARLNFIESLMVRVMEQAGFPERIFTNAKPEGIWSPTAPVGTPYADKQTLDGTTYYLIPTPRTLGASITTELVGLDRKDPMTGSIVGAETPGATMFPPTDPSYAIILARHARATILRQCKQSHMELDDQAAPSGFARLVAKAPFIADVENNRPPLEGMLRDLVEVVIRLASLMSNEFAGFLDRFRVNVTAHVNTGPVDPEEQAAILAQVNAGLLSSETALEQLGVEDTMAELDRLRNEPQAVLTMLQKQFEAMNTGTTSGLQLGTVAKLVGFTDEQQALIDEDARALTQAPEQGGDTVQVQDARTGLPGQTPPQLAPFAQAARAGVAPPFPALARPGAPPMTPIEGAPPADPIAAMMRAVEELTKQVESLQAQLAQQQTTVNSPVTVGQPNVTVNNGPTPEQVAPRRMVRVKRIPDGTLIGEIVTDPEQVSIPPTGNGTAEGEIVGVTA